MSRKPKFDADLKRAKAKRLIRERVLIVCEGSKTEPNYFQALVDDLKLNTAKVDVDGSSGSSPRSVVQHAKERFKRESDFDRVYCVFDQDEHQTYREALATIQNASPKNIFVATPSVPCFEFWIFLHYEYTTKPFIRAGDKSPGDGMKIALKKHLPKYEKGDKGIYVELKPRTGIAIANAKKANNAAVKSDTDNPSTMVYELVEYLQKLKT